MTIQVSAHCWAPPFAQDYDRDLRARWALEEEGLPYAAALIDPQTGPGAIAPPTAQVSAWVIAALNAIERHAQNFINLGGGDDVTAGTFAAMLENRLEDLADWLGDRDHLEDRFTAADLVMTTVLRQLAGCGMLARFPTLDAYRARCEARPAFARALEAQMATFREHAPG